jgi:putative Holliday junction resolvase
MERTKIMALDIGQKRTGIAVSDESLIFSFARGVVEAVDRAQWVSRVARLVEEEEIARIVVGLPLDHHGEEGEDARKIRQYIALLQARVEIPVVEWDERFTTVQAERTLLTADLSRKKRKHVIDKVAAQIILQSYLDSLRFQSEEL